MNTASISQPAPPPFPGVPLSVRDVRTGMLLLMLGLLSYGALYHDFEISLDQVLLTYSAGAAAHFILPRLLGFPAPAPFSTFITCTGISLLLRSATLWVHPAAALIAVSSKYLIRIRGKHLFNPANLGVLAAVSLLPASWISPGQWGNEIGTAALFLGLGSIVVFRAAHTVTSAAFLGVYIAAFIVRRVLWIGYPAEFTLYELQSGSLLLFTFFMISDPRTTPDSRAGKVIFGAVTALFAFIWQHELLRTSGPLWALFYLSPLVPILDILFRHRRYEWRNNAKEPVCTSGVL